MSNVLQSYLSLTSVSPRTDVSDVLQSIIAASVTLDTPSRQHVITVLLRDLKACHRGDEECRISPTDAPPLLSTVKTLARHPAGSDIIAEPSNLSLLLLISTSSKLDPATSNEALRCVANALFLIEQARDTWSSDAIGGGTACVEILQASRSANPDRLFLVSRILFLCTASRIASGSFIRTLVENRYDQSSIVDIIGAKLDTLLLSMQRDEHMAREALTDLLKLVFNLLVHYPKLVSVDTSDIDDHNQDDRLMPEDWSSQLDHILTPLLRAFDTLAHVVTAPLTPPLTHVIHALITIPISPTLRPMWFPLFGRGADEAPLPDPDTVVPEAMMLVHLEYPQDRHSGADESPPRHGPEQLTSNVDIVLRAFKLFQSSLAYYLPRDIDPDDPEVRLISQKSGQDSLDDTLRPLTLLITRLAIGDSTSRTRLREWILPADLDRTSSLETRPDTLGRCLRLLGSVYHPNLKDAVGEMLYAICDSDAATLCSLVGYGNVAGFLFQKDVLDAPSANAAAPLTTPSGIPINPITGVIEREVTKPEMTDEEKEQEAERLFVLFDRLEKSGAIHPSQNPIRKAMQGA